MLLNLAQSPFSVAGSYLSLAMQDPAVRPSSERKVAPGYYLRTHRGRGVNRRELFRLELIRDGRPVPAADRSDAAQVVLTPRRGAAGRVAVTIDGPDTVRFRGSGGLGLRLEMAVGMGTVAHPDQQGRWVVNARPSRCRCMFEPLRGGLKVDAPWRPDQCEHIVVDLLPDEKGGFDAAMDVFFSTWKPRPRPNFDQVLAGLRRRFAEWQSRTPPAPRRWRRAWEHAAYLNWSCLVEPEGLLTRPAMFMSKNWMDQVWSWDHAFNAMALAAGHPQLAFDQFMLEIDQQDEFGAFPDWVNDCISHYCFSKPPVHGWALRYCMAKAPRFFGRQRLAELYPGLARWTDWWLEHRRADRARLPHYLHGNDSGWDNSTMFDHGAPLVAPDLASFLVLQTEVLAELARRLGKPAEARRWQAASTGLLHGLLAELWRGDHFIARRGSDGFEVHCDSLVPCVPMVLGRRLPAEVRQALVRRIRRFLTPHGLATELTDSKLYTPDGYWRGPIWAPPTMLIVHGLAESGEKALARDIARRFCDLCAKSGFAENFNALTGQALRDPAYTWTSSVFLVLAADYAG